MPGRETTTWLQAASLAWDLDRRFEDEDRLRFESIWGEPPRTILVGGVDGGRYEQPLFYPVTLAPFVRVAPKRGALFLNAALLGAICLVASKSLGRRLGETAPALVALVIFGSVAWGSLYLLQNDLFLLAAGIVTLAAVIAGRPGLTPPSDVYEKPPTRTGMIGAIQWVAIGALAALPATAHPAGLALLLPLGVAGRRAGVRWLAVTVGFVAVFGVVIGTGGLWPDLGGDGGSLDLTLAVWNGIYSIVGRHLGILPFFFLWVLLLSVSGTRDRIASLLSVGLAIVLWILSSPFDIVGGAPSLGNRLFLPLFGAALMVPNRLPRLGGWVLALPVSAVLAGGLWVSPGASPVDPGGRYGHVTALADRWLPFELSQSSIPGAFGIRQDKLRVRCLNSAVRPSSDGGALALEDGAWGELQISADGPLERVFLEFDSRAGTELIVKGGEAGQMLFHPGGGVGFEVFLEEPRRVHEMWWTTAKQWNYVLRVRLPEASGGSVRFEVSSKGFAV